MFNIRPSPPAQRERVMCVCTEILPGSSPNQLQETHRVSELAASTWGTARHRHPLNVHGAHKHFPAGPRGPEVSQLLEEKAHRGGCEHAADSDLLLRNRPQGTRRAIWGPSLPIPCSREPPGCGDTWAKAALTLQDPDGPPASGHSRPQLGPTKHRSWTSSMKSIEPPDQAKFQGVRC